MSERYLTIKGPAYPAARAISVATHEHFARRIAEARAKGKQGLAQVPDAAAVEAIVDAAFWASLRREEGYSPKISLAFLTPEEGGGPLRFEQRLALGPVALSRRDDPAVGLLVQPAGDSTRRWVRGALDSWLSHAHIRLDQV